MSKDLEKKRARDRKYRRSKKGRAKTKNYLEQHKSEYAKKREEERERRLQAFCRWYSIDYWIIKRLMALRDNGIDIVERDPHNAKYVLMWEGKLRKKKEEKDRKDRVVASSEYL